MGTVTSITTARSRQPVTYRPLLTPAEVAAAFKCDPKTITRWANEGRLSSLRTPGGHRRFFEDEVRALLNGRRP
jgi:excisionase family DNA binding protein